MWVRRGAGYIWLRLALYRHHVSRYDELASLDCRGAWVKILWWDGQGFCLSAKRLEKGRFVWPSVAGGTAAALTPAQVAMLLEGINWRRRCAPTGRGLPAQCGRLTQGPAACRTS